MANFSEREFVGEEKEVETEVVKCEGCGSNMVFDPETQTLTCLHCGNKKNFGDTKLASEQDLASGLLNAPEWTADEVALFCCENCGAKVILKQGETATSCPFCSTAHVRKTEELLGIKPHAVLPFTFGVKKAVEFAKTWAKKRLFAPRKFKKNIKTDSVNGIYTPCFTFDSHTASYYEGKIGITKTRTVGSGKNRRTEVYTVWRHICGTFNHQYDDILITAGSKFTQSELDRVAPFNTNDSKEYKEEYLLGFMAYHYDSKLEDCWSNAKSKIDSDLKRRILSQYVHDKVAYLNVSTSHNDVTYKYVMLPVYVGAYKYASKDYNFFVNGNSGKVYGKTPISPWRVLIAVAIVVLIIVGIVLISNNFT